MAISILNSDKLSRGYDDLLFGHHFLGHRLVLMARFEDNLDKPVPECQTILDFLQPGMIEVVLVTVRTLR